MNTIRILTIVLTGMVLILFLLYFIGRIISIFAFHKIWKDRVYFSKEKFDEYNIVDHIYADKKKKEPIYGILVSEEGIRKLKVYEVDVNDGTAAKGKLIFSKELLNIEQAIAIHVKPGSEHPSLILEYDMEDYMQVTMPWKDEGQNGFYGEHIIPSHTLKSFLYYLLK